MARRVRSEPPKGRPLRPPATTPSKRALVQAARTEELELDEEFESLIKEMPHKQRRFVEEYLIDFNGAEAARRAGYSMSSKAVGYVAAYRLLRLPKVSRAIELGMEAYSKRAIITRERIEAELASMAFSNMEDYISVGSDGAPFFDLSLLTRDQAAAIQEITVTRGKGRKSVRVKLADKKAAIEMLAKLKGFYEDKSDKPSEFVFHVTYDPPPAGEITDGSYREVT